MDKTTKTSSYILREIPQELWDKVKHRAIDDQITLRDLVFRAIRAYLRAD